MDGRLPCESCDFGLLIKVMVKASNQRNEAGCRFQSAAAETS